MGDWDSEVEVAREEKVVEAVEGWIELEVVIDRDAFLKDLSERGCKLQAGGVAGPEVIKIGFG